MEVASEDDVWLESLYGFVRESSWREDDREVTDEDPSESGVLLRLFSLTVGQQRHLMNDPIDVIEVEIVFKFPLAPVLKVIIESLHFRRFHHLRSLTANIVVAWQVNCVDSIDLRKNVDESRIISLVSCIVGERRLV